MITQYEANSLLRQEVPELNRKVYPSRESLQVYTSMNYFSNYTKHLVHEHNFNAAKRCFNLAERLFRNGDSVVRMLIENVFVYGFSSMLPTDKTDRLIVRSIMPHDLYSLYMKQVNQSGC